MTPELLELLQPPPPAPSRGELDEALVEGDRLLLAGDPRGELVVVQARLNETGTDELRALEARLLEQHVDEWLGGAVPKGVEIRWRLGRIDAIAINLLWNDDAATLLRRIASRPAGRELRALFAYGHPRHRGPRRSTLPDTFTDVAQTVLDMQPPLRELVFDFSCQPEWDLGDPGFGLGQLGAFWSALPALEHVSLQALEMSLELVDEPPYRYFAAKPHHGLYPFDLEAVVNARWPRLTTLAIAVGHASSAAVQPLLDGTNTPALTHLELHGVRSEIIDRLSGSAILPRLDTLAVFWGQDRDDPAPTLDPDDRAFAHLKRFDFAR